jgi:hypothetical protein
MFVTLLSLSIAQFAVDKVGVVAREEECAQQALSSKKNGIIHLTYPTAKFGFVEGFAPIDLYGKFDRRMLTGNAPT